MKSSSLLVLLAVLVLCAGVAFAFINPTAFQSLTPSQGQVACTMEAKICPDGSAVGRTGPNCEFAACPTTSTTTGGGDGQVFCAQDVKQCSDGSYVSRKPPTCAFAACPTASSGSTTLTAGIGQSVTAFGVTLTPLALVDDSRCPTDVQCIWAGTVHVNVRIKSGLGTSEMTLELGKPITTEAEIITLVSVTPAPKSGTTIAASSYKFVFEVSKR